MLTAVTGFASSSAAESGILGSLGIDVQLLVLQTVAFLLLLFILAKWVFPSLNAMLDRRDKAIAESLKAAAEAEKNATNSQHEVEKLLKQARKDADEILATAKIEASNLVDGAEKKSRERADRIVAEAEAEIRHDIEKARIALKKETIRLVAAATEKVVGHSVNADIDQRIIKSAVNEVEKA
jgi:F-type H+-transporting ATPase subunit b